MKRIIGLTDYKGNFGSKWDNFPYRSGMDKDLLKEYFRKNDLSLEFVKFSKFKANNYSASDIILYTSSEDNGYIYKDYIEDVILYAQESGMVVIPEFKYLRANNNKVFMELLKKTVFSKEINNLKSTVFGVFEDVKEGEIEYPIVIKEAAGAMSTGVFLAKNRKELNSIARRISRTPSYKNDIKDSLRPYKHSNYIKESRYRKKFIIQEFVPNLKSDYKVLVFGERYYIFERPVRKSDFRASGSGNKNYIYGSNVKLPDGIFDFSNKVFGQAKVPHLSIDIVYDGKEFYVIEFQSLYFGTVGLSKSDGYYKHVDNNWKFLSERLKLEQVYADSLWWFIKNNY